AAGEGGNVREKSAVEGPRAGGLKARPPPPGRAGGKGDKGRGRVPRLDLDRRLAVVEPRPTPVEGLGHHDPLALGDTRQQRAPACPGSLEPEAHPTRHWRARIRQEVDSDVRHRAGSRSAREGDLELDGAGGTEWRLAGQAPRQTEEQQRARGPPTASHLPSGGPFFFRSLASSPASVSYPSTSTVMIEGRSATAVLGCASGPTPSFAAAWATCEALVSAATLAASTLGTPAADPLTWMISTPTTAWAAMLMSPTTRMPASPAFTSPLGAIKSR